MPTAPLEGRLAVGCCGAAVGGRGHRQALAAGGVGPGCRNSPCASHLTGAGGPLLESLLRATRLAFPASTTGCLCLYFRYLHLAVHL